MRKPTRAADKSLIDYVDYLFKSSGIADFGGCKKSAQNPFGFHFLIKGSNDRGLVERTCNKLFHNLGLLPRARNLSLGDACDYCMISRAESGDVDELGDKEDWGNDDFYFVFFNNPIVKLFSDDDPEAQFLLKSCFIDEDDDDDGET